jgi:hypothetical protein
MKVELSWSVHGHLRPFHSTVIRSGSMPPREMTGRLHTLPASSRHRPRSPPTPSPASLASARAVSPMEAAYGRLTRPPRWVVHPVSLAMIRYIARSTETAAPWPMILRRRMLPGIARRSISSGGPPLRLLRSDQSEDGTPDPTRTLLICVHLRVTIRKRLEQARRLRSAMSLADFACLPWPWLPGCITTRLLCRAARAVTHHRALSACTAHWQVVAPAPVAASPAARPRLNRRCVRHRHFIAIETQLAPGRYQPARPGMDGLEGHCRPADPEDTGRRRSRCEFFP